MDQGGPTDLLRLILEHDKRFAKVQEQYQEQYSRLCQAVKKSQRYPVCDRRDHFKIPKLA